MNEQAEFVPEIGYKELLIGCGNDRRKRAGFDTHKGWHDLTTLDIDPYCFPDLVYDLNDLPYKFADDNEYDEIHAYEVLEHVGQQGDYRFFFRQFEEFWRILKPNGVLIGSCPHRNSPWAWGDPGHTRIIGPEQLTFLDQTSYAQIGETAMTDYRGIYKADFSVEGQEHDDRFFFVLQVIKPARNPTIYGSGVIVG